MFKLPHLPSPHANLNELTDFAELITWKHNTVSKQKLVNILARNDENEIGDGDEDNEDKIRNLIDDLLNEVDRRKKACGRGYPFQISNGIGTVISLNDKEESKYKQRVLAYKFMLLATRINMTSHKIHANLDGTSLFEPLSANALRNYLGRCKAKSFIFGTSATDRRFKSKVDQLCTKLGEGSGFHNPGGGRVTSKDGKLDIVAWIPFTDERPGKLIVFGQCKTGSNWRDTLSQLQPSAFCQKYMNRSPLVIPQRAFFISEEPDTNKHHEDVIDGGLMFNRCRLVDCSDYLPEELCSQIMQWTDSAINTVDI